MPLARPAGATGLIPPVPPVRPDPSAPRARPTPWRRAPPSCTPRPWRPTPRPRATGPSATRSSTGSDGPSRSAGPTPRWPGPWGAAASSSPRSCADAGERQPGAGEVRPPGGRAGSNGRQWRRVRPQTKRNPKRPPVSPLSVRMGSMT